MLLFVWPSFFVMGSIYFVDDQDLSALIVNLVLLLAETGGSRYHLGYNTLTRFFKKKIKVR